MSSETALLTDQAASDVIKARVAGDEPALIGRLGGRELNCVFAYLAVRRDAPLARRAVRYAKLHRRTRWDEGDISSLAHFAGVFPPETQIAERFSELMLADMAAIDVLGVVGTAREEEARPYLRNPVGVRLRDLEPYYHRNPWTEALDGRDVLVVHPFAESIKSQYARRELLFEDASVLPEFSLTVLPAVQSIAGNPTNYPTWFHAYRDMCARMEEVTFDVAIVGCGAYGLPLAAHAKRLGKKGVHLGGAVQILFGIKGRRWDNHEFISRLYNEHWVRPLPSERPPNYLEVEDGCYW